MARLILLGLHFIPAAVIESGEVLAALGPQVAGADISRPSQAACAAVHMVQPALPRVQLAGNCARKHSIFIWGAPRIP